MSRPVIEVHGLSKRYVLQHESRHDNLRDQLHHTARKLWRRVRWGTGFKTEEFWALRDISFAVERGEVLGIVGRNGAGKSTLLKILSRITEPTSGNIRLRGRVASLLEVGTGFHPDLTGRENIFLNGAILGMSRAEIRRKFDEIVAFAEVERFLDTPVKRYSSGMYVRLAFAVAAHLEPEILIVDEVLAVGDLAFQKKCVGKMQSVAAQEGRTVLFVSHNLHAVRRLCTRALLLAGGRLAAAGPTQTILAQFAEGIEGDTGSAVPAPSPELLTQAYVTGAWIETPDGQPLGAVHLGEPWRVRVGFRVARPMSAFVVAIGFRSNDDIGVQTAWAPPQAVEPGDYEAVFTQDRLVLSAGTYAVIVGLNAEDRTIQQIRATAVDVTAEHPRGYFPYPAGAGYVLNSMPVRVSRL